MEIIKRVLKAHNPLKRKLRTIALLKCSTKTRNISANTRKAFPRTNTNFSQRTRKTSSIDQRPARSPLCRVNRPCPSASEYSSKPDFLSSRLSGGGESDSLLRNKQRIALRERRISPLKDRGGAASAARGGLRAAGSSGP